MLFTGGRAGLGGGACKAEGGQRAAAMERVEAAYRKKKLEHAAMGKLSRSLTLDALAGNVGGDGYGYHAR